MGTCFAVTFGMAFSTPNAEKNEKLLFCVGSGETALRARQSEIFEESASHHIWHYELLNLFLNDHHHVPRSTYRKAIEGVRTVTYGAHTTLAAVQKSHKFATNITTPDNHQPVFVSGKRGYEVCYVV